MRLGAIRLIAANGQIIHSDSLHAAPGQIVCRGLGNVYEVLLKLVGCPSTRGIDGLEKDAVAFLKTMPLHLLNPDHLLIFNGDDARRPDSGSQRHAVDGMASRDEVRWSIHVRADVRGGAEFRKVALIAAVEAKRESALE